MNPELSQEILQRIDALAAKMGVVSAQLFEMFVAQAAARGASDMALGILFFVVMFACASFVALYGIRNGGEGPIIAVILLVSLSIIPATIATRGWATMHAPQASGFASLLAEVRK